MRPCQIRKRRKTRRPKKTNLTRRQLFEATVAASAAVAGASALGGCAVEEETGSQAGNVTDGGAFPGAVAGFENEADRVKSVREVVDMLGGMPWIKNGDHVVIKPAHNSFHAYPFTASPESVTELVKMALDAGAGKVTVADSMGVEHTLVPGGWHLESPFDRKFWKDWDPDDDATVLAMKNSGLYGAVADTVGNDLGGRVKVTSFREDGWARYESERDTPDSPRLYAGWVKEQLKGAINWENEEESRFYIKRKFDLLRRDVPGMYVPRVINEADHIINVHRASTHIWSHATHALKNWIGIMRPDERLWMHQLNYLKNRRHDPSDPASTECPYHEMLAELHMSTWERERMIICDAQRVTLSGGPDETSDPFYPANVMIGATDLVTADVLSVAVVKMGVLASLQEAGLAAECKDQPKSTKELVVNALGISLPWRDTEDEFRGTDTKLCDPSFSPWDWLAIRRAIELGMGPRNFTQVDLKFGEGAFRLPDARRGFIEDELALPARFS